MIKRVAIENVDEREGSWVCMQVVNHYWQELIEAMDLGWVFYMCP